MEHLSRGNKNINRAGTRKLIITDDEVIKIQDKNKAKTEYVKTIAGKKIGESTGLFFVPDVKIDSEDRLIFKKLRNLISLSVFCDFLNFFFGTFVPVNIYILILH